MPNDVGKLAFILPLVRNLISDILLIMFISFIPHILCWLVLLILQLCPVVSFLSADWFWMGDFRKEWRNTSDQCGKGGCHSRTRYCKSDLSMGKFSICLLRNFYACRNLPSRMLNLTAWSNRPHFGLSVSMYVGLTHIHTYRYAYLFLLLSLFVDTLTVSCKYHDISRIFFSILNLVSHGVLDFVVTCFLFPSI